MSPVGLKEPIRLVTIHGIGDPPPNYAYYFWQELETQLGIAIVHRSVWYGDLTRYVGLTNAEPWEGRLTARWADYALDVLKYTTDWGVRGEIRDRVNQAFDSPNWNGWHGKTLMVTHSWGGVVAWNHVPNNEVDLWVSFNTRRYLNTRFTHPPKVGKWVNVWSPEDKLSSAIKGPENLMIHGGHSPLWTSDTKIDLTSMYWKTTYRDYSNSPT